MTNKIKYLRRLNNITQQNLADYLNVSRASVNAWESNLSTPSTSDIILMSDKFNVSTDFLIKANEKESLIITALTNKQKQVLKDLITCYNE